MTRKTLVIAFTLLFAVALYARDSKDVKVTGFLLDNNCTAGHEKDKDFPEWAKKHGTNCAKMESCEKSGYVVYADEKVYKLDEAGNTMASELLKNTQVAKGLKVTVEGTLEGDTIKVTKLTEVAG